MLLGEDELRELEQLYRVVVYARRAIDLPHFQRSGDEEEYSQQRQLLSDLEALRLAFRTLTRQSQRSEHPLARYLLGDIRKNLDSILQNPAFQQLNARQFRAIGNNVREIEADRLALELTAESYSVRDAFLLCQDRVANFFPGEESGINLNFDADKFRSLIPAQKVAPTQFSIQDERIVVVPQPPHPLEGAAGLASAAKDEILYQGQEILDGLERSNCHSRITKAFERLNSKVASSNNIIEIGLSAITCKALLSQFSEEIPDDALALMRAHLHSVDLFLGQFQDWHDFCVSDQKLS